MNLRLALADHGMVRLLEIDEAIATHLRAVRALHAERVAVAMHLFIADATDADATETAATALGMTSAGGDHAR